MGLAFVGRDGILRADWQSAHSCSWSLPPANGDEKLSPPLMESIGYAVFRAADRLAMRGRLTIRKHRLALNTCGVTAFHLACQSILNSGELLRRAARDLRTSFAWPLIGNSPQQLHKRIGMWPSKIDPSLLLQEYGYLWLSNNIRQNDWNNRDPP